MIGKVPYLCAGLTGLPRKDHPRIKGFYAKIADACQEKTGVRPYVPHEHSDPVLNKDLTPPQVYNLDENQVQNKTSVLIVVFIPDPRQDDEEIERYPFGSCGVGMEIQMAREKRVPIIFLFPIGHILSRLPGGVPGLEKILYYENQDHALQMIKEAVTAYHS
ncbi:MAG: hypothetical protein A2908_03190 [Candidatus Staskawiczbacteria bacterium RIFCSPLOWO2_01_FULL_38_12b]|uniref:CD-NTase-associated protein 12/Pycsar effector protein TIR domain-containing protein n=1 Tax=Candidatus Staskawiczbacteria bacterium RIFCSPLOWO2_01_FULL_38_12b TaxID=1802214 RepID=A0A1G2ICG1_9BACT|nr:MAG: hypothetical protein A2908_03190 [Candidatus Staskawiczbacteria bacterium RIFCSPLOWO2_01_FULL_38_12b]